MMLTGRIVLLIAASCFFLNSCSKKTSSPLEVDKEVYLPPPSPTPTPTPTPTPPPLDPLSCVIEDLPSSLELLENAQHVPTPSILQLSASATRNGTPVSTKVGGVQFNPSTSATVLNIPQGSQVENQVQFNLADFGEFTISVNLIDEVSQQACIAQHTMTIIKKVITGGSAMILINGKASPDPIYYNGQALVEWGSVGTTACVLKKNGANTSFTGVSGQASFVNLMANTQFSIACDANATASASLTVLPAPTLSLKANGSATEVTVDPLSNVLLEWQATNVFSCELSNASTVLKTGRQGNLNVSSGTSPVVYTLRCKNNVGVVLASKSISVNPQAAANTPYVELSSNRAQVAFGGSVKLTWQSTGADSCQLVKNSSGQSLSTALTATDFNVPNLQQSVVEFRITCKKYVGLNVYSKSAQVSVQVSNPTDHVAYVSSLLFTGSLKGLFGADEKCKDMAVAAGLRPDRPWKAILSVAGVSAASRISLVGPVKNKNVLISSATDFWKASTSWGTSIRYDEKGKDPFYLPNNVWTGTEINGTVGNANTCKNWTSLLIFESGQVGDSRSTGTSRLDAGNASCLELKRLYCISQ